MIINSTEDDMLLCKCNNSFLVKLVYQNNAQDITIL